MISKKIRELFVSLMEAQCDNPSAGVSYQSDTEVYTGVFNTRVLDKFIQQGAIELVDHQAGVCSIIINNQQDFLSGFAAGVKEASLGRDQYYADYNANPFAFSLGYEHFLSLQKKPKKLVGYQCYGFDTVD